MYMCNCLKQNTRVAIVDIKTKERGIENEKQKINNYKLVHRHIITKIITLARLKS